MQYKINKFIKVSLLILTLVCAHSVGAYYSGSPTSTATVVVQKPITTQAKTIPTTATTTPAANAIAEKAKAYFGAEDTTAIVKPEAITSQFGVIEIKGANEKACPADRITYIVNYKNTAKTAITDVVVRVTFPTSIAFDQTSIGTFSYGDNSVAIPVGTLTVGQVGSIYISAHALNGVRDTKQAVILAEILFTNPNGKQDHALSYTFNDGSECQNLSASAFLGGGSFFPHSFFGWFFLILLIVLVVYLSRKFYYENNKKSGHVAHAH